MPIEYVCSVHITDEKHSELKKDQHQASSSTKVCEREKIVLPEGKQSPVLHDEIGCFNYSICVCAISVEFVVVIISSSAQQLRNYYDF